MNRVYLLGCMLVLLLNTTAKAQSSKDSTASFKVSGVCEMCENRIEKALKIKGITSADWDVDTKILSLVFNPSRITLDKVHERLAGVGHDTELKKSKESTYKALPDCCRYREMGENESHHDEGEVVLIDTTMAANNYGKRIGNGGKQQGNVQAAGRGQCCLAGNNKRCHHK